MLEYGADGRVTINKQPVPMADLQERLTALYRDRHDKTLFVMGDGSLRYGSIVEAIDLAKGAGVEKVGIVTESMRRGAEMTKRPAPEGSRPCQSSVFSLSVG